MLGVSQVKCSVPVAPYQEGFKVVEPTEVQYQIALPGGAMILTTETLQPGTICNDVAYTCPNHLLIQFDKPAVGKAGVYVSEQMNHVYVSLMINNVVVQLFEADGISFDLKPYTDIARLNGVEKVILLVL